MEEFLSERRSTISYKDGNIFRKYYKYANELEVLSEKNFSLEAYESGVHCPRFISWGYCNEKCMFYIEYEFVEIQPINRAKANLEIIRMALEQLDKMPICNHLNNVSNEKLKKDLFSVISFLPKDIKEEYQCLIVDLLKQNSAVMIHGDYSFENIGWDIKNNSVIVFDFQNSGYGVQGWDKSYLLSSIPNIEYTSLLSDNSIELIKIITALKYGRGIRKKFEIEERKKIYEYWWK